MSWSSDVKKNFDYWKRLTECRATLKNICSDLPNCDDSDKKIKEMYAYAKMIIPEFFIDGEFPYMHCSYDFFRDDLINYERLFEEKFITESEPIFDFFDNREIDDYADPDDILNYIIYNVRRYLVLSHSFNQRRPTDINRLDFENDCLVASNKVKELCDQLWLESHIIGIYPGYMKHNDLYNGNGFHMANIVKIEDKYYLVDCTYRQFFTYRQNFLDRLGVVEMAGCKAGRFMMMDENRKNIACSILKNGYIQLDDEVLKHYLDGFTLSYRNGLYYEQTGDFSYTTNYDVDTYIKFLRGEDNQLNHEDREVLGYQKRPLKNLNMKFEKNKNDF